MGQKEDDRDSVVILDEKSILTTETQRTQRGRAATEYEKG
jgi:hypothetical protein